MTPIYGRKLIDELIKQGIADDLTQRVTIDIPVDGIPTVFVQKVGDKRLLSIVPVIADNPALDIQGVPSKEVADDD